MKSTVVLVILLLVVVCWMVLTAECATTKKPITIKPTTKTPTTIKPTTKTPTTAKITATTKPTTTVPIYTDPCKFSPCRHNGTCKRVSNTNYLCSCNQSIAFGSRCENLNPCYLFPCLYGGTCKPYGLNYTCSCIESAYGNNCQYFRDPNANNSTLLEFDSKQNLKTLLNISVERMYLLYRASVDGFDSKSFHSKCDGALGTLVLIKSENSNIFGGFTKANWGLNTGWQTDYEAFLFSLVNRYNTPVKMLVAQPSYAIISGSSHIYFGGDGSLYLSNDGTTGSSYFNSYYRVPSFLATNEINSFLGGAPSFNIFEIEVYSQYDPCNSSPCKNGRKCLFSNRNYVCSCINGEYGKNCQYKILNSTIFKNSSILTYEKSIELSDLLKENRTIWSKTNYTQLYQATKDGFDSKSFHSKCDGALGTLVLIKSENSNIFGGFTKANWGLNSGWQSDSESFLFSLVNSYNTPVKMLVAQPYYAILSDLSRHIYFGDRALSLSGDGTTGSSYFNYNYYETPSFLTDDPNIFLGGIQNFNIVEIEVYLVRF